MFIYQRVCFRLFTPNLKWAPDPLNHPRQRGQHGVANTFRQFVSDSQAHGGWYSKCCIPKPCQSHHRTWQSWQSSISNVCGWDLWLAESQCLSWIKSSLKMSSCFSSVFFPMENDWVFIVMSQNVDQKSIICWICFFSSGWIIQFAGCVASTHLNHCFCRITTNLWEPRFPLAPNVLAYIRLKFNTIGFSLLIFLDSVLFFHREISSPAGMAKDAKRRPLLECGESDSCVLPSSLNSSGFGDETLILETSAWLTRRVLAAAVAEAPCWRKRFVHINWGHDMSRFVQLRPPESWWFNATELGIWSAQTVCATPRSTWAFHHNFLEWNEQAWELQQYKWHFVFKTIHA